MRRDKFAGVGVPDDPQAAVTTRFSGAHAGAPLRFVNSQRVRDAAEIGDRELFGALFGIDAGSRQDGGGFFFII